MLCGEATNDTKVGNIHKRTELVLCNTSITKFHLIVNMLRKTKWAHDLIVIQICQTKYHFIAIMVFSTKDYSHHKINNK